MEETAQAMREHSESNKTIQVNPNHNIVPPPTNFAWPEHYVGIKINYLFSFLKFLYNYFIIITF